MRMLHEMMPESLTLIAPSLLCVQTAKGGLKEIRLNKNFRSASKTIASQNQRSDLTRAVKAKYAGIYSANMVKKGLRKKTVIKAGRN